MCEKVFSNRKDNIRRHIRHLHADVNKSDISQHIETVEDDDDVLQADDDDFESTDAQIGDDEEQEDITLQESLEFVDQPPITPSPPPPVINNRVKVIQSIGNPNKHHQSLVPPATEKDTLEEALLPQLPQKPQDNETENKLPPKKKAIALNHSCSSATTVKPKYDPIQHYRKILLGFSKDDDSEAKSEDNIEEENIGQEDQVFPVHWRKRTSQNFLFRR